MDYDIQEGPCPKCGHDVLHSRRCDDIGCEDGYTDAYEDDPINESPGTWEVCRECHGTGILRWCPKCGTDHVYAATEVENDLPDDDSWGDRDAE